MMEKQETNQRGRWFDLFKNQREYNLTHLRAEGAPYRCPCCGCRTLDQRGIYDICPVCFWEDDGQDDADADVVRGGPNGTLSLTQARRNYAQFGACEERMLVNVRPPTPAELSE